jgi:enoyl-CoA hydratase/carnithine racemase
MRIASERAQFGLPEIAYGMGGGGGITRLGRQIPHVVAMRFLLTGEFMSAQHALKYDMINEVVPADQLMARAMALASTIAAHPPIAVRVEMESYYQSLDLGRNDNLRYSMNLYRLQRLGYEGFGAGSGFLKRAKAEQKPEP